MLLSVPLLFVFILKKRYVGTYLGQSQLEYLFDYSSSGLPYHSLCHWEILGFTQICIFSIFFIFVFILHWNTTYELKCLMQFPLVPGSSSEDTHQAASSPSSCESPSSSEGQEAGDGDGEDDKSVDSFNTAASSLSIAGNVCKICHCGDEVQSQLSVCTEWNIVWYIRVWVIMKCYWYHYKNKKISIMISRFYVLFFQEGEPILITPCLCSGSLKFVHQECLHR